MADGMTWAEWAGIKQLENRMIRRNVAKADGLLRELTGLETMRRNIKYFIGLTVLIEGQAVHHEVKIACQEVIAQQYDLLLAAKWRELNKIGVYDNPKEDDNADQ